jgi:hypothetical protein
MLGVMSGTARLAAGRSHIAAAALVLTLVCWLLASPAAARAAQLTVTVTGDTTTACTAIVCSLRGAIQHSAARDVIIVPAGHYTLSGDLPIEHTLSFVGSAGADSTIIDAGGTSRIFTVTGSSTLTLTGLSLTGGNGTGTVNSGPGGAIYQQSGSLNLVKDDIYGNAASLSTLSTYSGGAIDSNGSGLTITNSSIHDNTAAGSGATTNNQFGGAIDSAFGPDPLIVDSTIANNTAGGPGGGLFVSGATLTSDTIADNDAGSGGAGIDGTMGGSFHTVNTLIASNLTSNADVECGSNVSLTTGDLGYNVTSDSSCGLNDVNDHQNVAAQLGTLGLHGGTTSTVPILPNSPALNAGYDAACPATDQRGESRPVGAHCDIGAYEYNSSDGYAATSDPDNIGAYAALLHGGFSPAASGTYKVWFDWGSTTSYGNQTPTWSGAFTGHVLGAFNWWVDFAPQTTYHYRIHVQGGGNSWTGSDKTVTTGAANLRGACTNGISTNGSTYSYELCSAPDLDQVRLGQLASDGEMFCVPTSTFDAFDYLSVQYPAFAPAGMDFSIPANFKAGSTGIAKMGTYMGTDGVNGTYEAGFINGLEKWLADGGSSSSYITYDDVNEASGVTVHGIAGAATTGGVVLLNIGTFNSVGTRVGGHEVLLSGTTGSWAANTATIDLSDPYTSALLDDVQSPYVADQLTITDGTFGSGSNMHTLPVMSGYAYPAGSGFTQAIDGYTVLSPKTYSVGGNGHVTFSTMQPVVPGTPVERQVSIPGQPIAIAEPGGGGVWDYVTASLAAGGRARHARATAAPTGALVEVDQTTGHSRVLVHRIAHPAGLVIGAADLRYVLEQDAVSAYTHAGKRLYRRVFKGIGAAGAIAWDQKAGRLGILDVPRKRLLIATPNLHHLSILKIAARLLPKHHRFDLAFTAHADAVLHVRGSRHFTVLKHTPTRSRPLLLVAADVTVRAGPPSAPANNFTIDAQGHVLLTVGTHLYAFTIGGKTLPAPAQPKGLTPGATFTELGNVDPLTPGVHGLQLDSNLLTRPGDGGH